MENKFTDEQIKILLAKNLTTDQIKGIEKTLELYNSTDSLIKITTDSILGLENLENYLYQTEEFTVEYSNIIKELVESRLDFENKDYLFNPIFVTKNTDENTSYYKIFVSNTDIKIYYLDYIFRVIKIKDLKLENIIRAKLMTIEHNHKNVQEEVFVINDHSNQYEYHLYSLDLRTTRILKRFNDFLVEKGTASTQKLDDVEPTKKTLKKYFLGMNMYGARALSALDIVEDN
ncbi:MAG: hypothetical protein ACRCYC_10300 [Paraclostridium sp.]|uniref:hypothetical protein n=1 Tax=Paraclostridium sp. TaxID=2023273 RepID=UPI003F31A3C4